MSTGTAARCTTLAPIGGASLLLLAACGGGGGRAVRRQQQWPSEPSRARHRGDCRRQDPGGHGVEPQRDNLWVVMLIFLAPVIVMIAVEELVHHIRNGPQAPGRHSRDSASSQSDS
jgi:hypothetical protein